MNTWKTANAVVRHLEATTPVYDVSEHGYSLVDAPLEGDARVIPGVRTYEDSLDGLDGLAAELRVRDDVGGWAW